MMPQTPNLFQLAAPSHHSLNIKIMKIIIQDIQDIWLVDIICVEANTVISTSGKHYHSLSVVNNGRKLVACGGTIDEGGNIDTKDCLSWESGQSEWKHFHTLRCASNIAIMAKKRDFGPKKKLTS